MTPGLAFFYGGLVKAKSVVSMMMMSFGSLALIGVLWILYGFSMSAVSAPTDFAGNLKDWITTVLLVRLTDLRLRSSQLH
jgi:ammonia channel protein AmtB